MKLAPRTSSSSYGGLESMGCALCVIPPTVPAHVTVATGTLNVNAPCAKWHHADSERGE